MQTQTKPPKCLLILLDGLADRSHPELDRRTPLQAASTPNLDRLAGAGSSGMYHALRVGAALPSEAAHFFMLGYTDRQFPGRGYLEAVGYNVPHEPGDVLLLAHLARTQPNKDGLKLIQRRPKLTTAQAGPYFQAIGQWEHPMGQARLFATKSSSAILRLRGDLSRFVTDSDPLIPGRMILKPRPWQTRADSLQARQCAELLTAYLKYAHEILGGLEPQTDEPPINALITQRAGQAGDIPSLAEQWGLKVLSLSSAPIYKGIFQALGAQADLVAEQSDPGDDLEAKVLAALDRLDDFDLIHVHTKAPDEAAHTKDPSAKMEVISSLDSGLVPLLDALEADPALLIVVTGDHATPSSGDMIHSGEPSPLIVAGVNAWTDEVSRFSEVHCPGGALGLLRGPELMQTILNHLDRGKLWGLMDDPRDLPYYPAGDEPL